MLKTRERTIKYVMFSLFFASFGIDILYLSILFYDYFLFFAQEFIHFVLIFYYFLVLKKLLLERRNLFYKQRVCFSVYTLLLFSLLGVVMQGVCEISFMLLMAGTID